MRWIEPLKGNIKALNLNLTFEKNRKAALDLARSTNTTVFSKSINLVQGGKGFLAFIPIQSHAKFHGFILAVFRVNHFFQPLINGNVFQTFNITILEDNSPIFTHIENKSTIHATENYFNIGQNNQWTVRFTPSVNYINTHLNNIPSIVLFVGLLISLLVTIVFYLFNLGHNRKLTLHQKAQEARLLHDSIKAVSNASSINEAIQNLLNSLCESIQWPIGHAYKHDKQNNQLTSTGLWYIRASKKESLAAFIDATNKTNFSIGIGLPGRVWKNKQPAWINDFHKDLSSPRAQLCRHVNLHNAFAFPIYDKLHNLVFVLEFFSPTNIRRDEEFLKLIKLLAFQINQAIQHLQIEKGIKQREEDLSLILESAGEGIYGLDLQGKTTFANPAALYMLGYTKNEVIGKGMHALIHYAYPDGSKFPREKCPMYAAFTDGKIHHISKGEVLWRKDGSSFPAEYTSTPIIKEGKLAGAVVIFKDKSIEQKQQRMINFNTTLINQLMVLQDNYIAGKPKKALFDEALKILQELTSSKFGFIGLVEHDKNGAPYLRTHSISDISWDEASREKYAQSYTGGMIFANLDTLFGYTLRAGRQLICNNPASSKHSGGLPKGHPALTSYMGIPIHGKDGLTGMISLGNRKGGYNKKLAKIIVPIEKTLSAILDAHLTNSKLETMALHDYLTGLYNRGFFEETLNRLCARPSDPKTSFTLMYLDLDNFKQINDSLGHETGDKVLQLTAKRIIKIVHANDIVSRIGGDEFTIILHNVHNPQLIPTIAKRLTNTIANIYNIGKKQITITTSVGVVSFPGSASTPKILLKNVATALYEAKKSGKNQYHIFRALTREKQLRIEKITDLLIPNLPLDSFFLVFQPVMLLSSQTVVGAEALLRLKNEKLGMVYPEEFIPLLEATNKILELGPWIIDTAFKQFAKVKDTLDSDFKLAINLSGKQLQEPNLARTIISRLQKHNLSAKNIALEITETSVMENIDATPILKELRDAGFSISIDDFGIDYSSLSRLSILPINTLKIDKSFVLNSSINNDSKLIIENTIALSRKLGLELIAEGIEKKSHLDFLLSQGCELGQGYYFAKPMPMNELLDYIASQNK